MVLLSLWATVAVLMGLLAATVVIAPLILEERLSSPSIPWIFIVVAASASAVAAATARLLRGVAARYSWLRLFISGIGGWPVAWWSGLEAMRTLEDARQAGFFAITFTLEHLSLWNAVIFVTAAILLVGARETAPIAGSA